MYTKNSFYCTPKDQNDFFKNEIIGKTIIDIRGDYRGSEKLCFLFDDGSAIKMFHTQDCCENVSIEDICGDTKDLLNTPILNFEVVTSNENPVCEYDESFTWTFYKIKTAKGYVDIRWYGESNGYYSESVDIEYYNPKQKIEDWDEKYFNNY